MLWDNKLHIRNLSSNFVIVYIGPHRMNLGLYCNSQTRMFLYLPIKDSNSIEKSNPGEDSIT